jgi:hypothetical protein
MTKHEVKNQIDQLLSSFPEDHLREILAYLEILKQLSGSNIKRSSNLLKIMREDREVLQKLAK